MKIKRLVDPSFQEALAAVGQLKLSGNARWAVTKTLKAVREATATYQEAKEAMWQTLGEKDEFGNLVTHHGGGLRQIRFSPENQALADKQNRELLDQEIELGVLSLSFLGPVSDELTANQLVALDGLVGE